ncbi:actin cytoskeleton-regulatory complex protein pan1-like [Phragmites australis]|uniref:actin cytoskeleton-regulatory complex protein pan1-like n=1 Tax=Phragmites australis TaxID=29695 RepID=UPI002D7981C7|nr:actin cytoskeleton-regulatory complex protein pan1-like [Phragmites australis]
MSYSYASRHRGPGMSTSTLLAAKVAFASAALAAAASFARLAVPQLVSVAGAVFPRVWAIVRFWLTPPYLFVTVHLIILVIWKLSDHRHFQAQAHHRDPWPVAQHTPHPPAAAVPAVEEAAPAVRAKEEFDSSAGYDEPLEPEFSPDSGGGESCVTTESDEDASSAPSSYLVDARRSVAPAQEHAVLERELSLPPQTVDFDGEGDDDLDATWNAIMQKTRPAPAAPAPAPPPPAQQPPPPPRARDPSVGAEEMNRRFDDFIKKNRHSFGRQ